MPLRVCHIHGECWETESKKEEVSSLQPPRPLSLQLLLHHFSLFPVCFSLSCCWIAGFKVTVV